jgi:hypothetical protein
LRPSLRGLLAAFVLGVLASPAAAQLQLAVVSGTVLDESGLAMAGSTIELTDPLGATISTTAADSSGQAGTRCARASRGSSPPPIQSM